MIQNKENNLSEEIRKIKYRVGYKINETPKYRSLVGSNEEFDVIPNMTQKGEPVPQSPSFTNEAGEQEDAIKPGGGEKPVEPTNDDPMNTQAPTPAFDQGNEEDNPETGNEKLPANPMGAPEPENNVDDIQNDIIKHNIEAMKSIHSQLESLNSIVQGLNVKIDGLNSEVEEVREPTNSEKLMSKKDVSYPYYFNLNDYWSGNWFEEKNEKGLDKGIKKLPDGTYIADFDDLPRQSKIDVQNSFNID